MLSDPLDGFFFFGDTLDCPPSLCNPVTAALGKPSLCDMICEGKALELEATSLFCDSVNCWVASALVEPASLGAICNPTSGGMGAAVEQPPISWDLVRSGAGAALEDLPISCDLLRSIPAALDGSLISALGVLLISSDFVGSVVVALEDPFRSCDIVGDPEAALEATHMSCNLVGGIPAALDEFPNSCDPGVGLAAPAKGFLFFFRDFLCDRVASALEDPFNPCDAFTGPAAAADGVSASCDAFAGPAAAADGVSASCDAVAGAASPLDGGSNSCDAAGSGMTAFKASAASSSCDIARGASAEPELLLLGSYSISGSVLSLNGPHITRYLSTTRSKTVSGALRPITLRMFFLRTTARRHALGNTRLTPLSGLVFTKERRSVAVAL